MGGHVNTGVTLRLRYAVTVLTAATGVTNWPRCATWLIRLALEGALIQLWRSRCPELMECSARAQLLALGKFTDADTQYRVSELWHTLSRAGHHHHFELSPTTQEIREWLHEAADLASRLDDDPDQEQDADAAVVPDAED